MKGTKKRKEKITLEAFMRFNQSRNRTDAFDVYTFHVCHRPIVTHPWTLFASLPTFTTSLCGQSRIPCVDASVHVSKLQPRFLHVYVSWHPTGHTYTRTGIEPTNVIDSYVY